MPGTLITQTSNPTLWTSLENELNVWTPKPGFIVYGGVHYQVLQSAVTKESIYLPYTNEELIEDTTKIPK